MARRTNPDFLNGVPEMLTLRLLARQPMYGYQLVEQLRMTSGEVFEFGEGCIYPILHRLEAEGLVTSARTQVQGRSRVTYQLSPAGHARLAATTADWQRIVATIAHMLEGAHVEHASLGS